MIALNVGCLVAVSVPERASAWEHWGGDAGWHGLPRCPHAPVGPRSNVGSPFWRRKPGSSHAGPAPACCRQSTIRLRPHATTGADVVCSSPGHKCRAFWSKLARQQAYTGGIAARLVEAGGEALLDRIEPNGEHDGNCRSRFSCCQVRWSIGGNQIATCR